MIIATKFKSIFLSFLILFVTVCATFVFSNKSADSKETSEAIPKLGFCVVLDAGHGVLDVK